MKLIKKTRFPLLICNRRIKIILFFTMLNLGLFCNSAYGQETTQESIFSNTHGIKIAEFTSYEVEGYAIYTKTISAQLHGAAFNKTKKRLNIPKDAIETTDSTFDVENKIYILETFALDTIPQLTIHCFLKENKKYLKIISLYNYGKRDLELEKLLIDGIRKKNIPKKIYSSQTIDSAKFVGRNLSLGSICKWSNAHNIQCPGNGQMNWSELRSLERAKEILEYQKL